MGFWSKLFGKKDDENEAKPEETMQNPAAPAEETPEVSEEEKTE